MKKRFAALAFVLVFLMSSLIGCGSKGASVATWAETMKQTQTMNTGTYTYSFGLTSTEKLLKIMESSVDESMKQIVTDLMQAEYQMQTTIESLEPMAMNVKFGIKQSGSDKLTPITTVIMKDDAMYINMAELKECLDSFKNPALSIISGMFTTQEDYLKYTVEDINKSLALSGQDAVTNFNMGMEGYAEAAEKMTEFSTTMIQNFEAAVKDITPAAVSNKDGKVILEINKENYEAVANKVCEDVIKNKETYFDQYVAALEKLESGKDLAVELKANKQKTLDEIQLSCDEIINTLKESKLLEGDDLNLKSEMSVKGSEGNREITTATNFYIKSTEDDMELGVFLKGNGTEKIASADKVTVPEKSITLDEFTKSLGQ